MLCKINLKLFSLTLIAADAANIPLALFYVLIVDVLTARVFLVSRFLSSRFLTTVAHSCGQKAAGGRVPIGPRSLLPIATQSGSFSHFLQQILPISKLILLLKYTVRYCQDIITKIIYDVTKFAGSVRLICFTG